MDRTLSRGAFALTAFAAATIAVAWAPSASAQITTGLPTGGSYSPYNTFAERWYNPGDWYGGARRTIGPGAVGATPAQGPARTIGVGPTPPGLGVEPGQGPFGNLDARATGMPSPGASSGYGQATGSFPGRAFDGDPRMTSPAAGQGVSRPTSVTSSWSDMPYFGRGYAPYSGAGEFDRSRDFYDRSRVGSPARARTPAGITPGVSAEGPGSGAGVGLAPGGIAVDRGPLSGDSDYVERGYLPDPSYGVGPRYRGYYTEDWYNDTASFDDWYDTGSSGRGGLDQPATGTGTGTPDTLGTPGGATEGSDPTGIPGATPATGSTTNPGPTGDTPNP